MHADCSECFNLYSSPDLGTWTFVVGVEGELGPNEGLPARPLMLAGMRVEERGHRRAAARHALLSHGEAQDFQVASGSGHLARLPQMSHHTQRRSPAAPRHRSTSCGSTVTRPGSRCAQSASSPRTPSRAPTPSRHRASAPMAATRTTWGHLWMRRETGERTSSAPSKTSSLASRRCGRRRAAPCRARESAPAPASSCR